MKARAVRSAAGGLLVLLLPGCYSFAPTAMEEVRTGENLRLFLSSDAPPSLREALSNTLSPDMQSLEGKLIERDDGSLLLLVPSVVEESAAGLRTFHQRVSVPERVVARIERKRLDALETGVLVAAGAVIGGVVIATQVGGGGPRVPGENGPRDAIIPIILGGLRLAWP